MNRTFRKTIACILAVLMVLTALPFTAFAVESNRKWWVDDGVDPASITSEPDFIGLNSCIDEEFPNGWEMNFGDAFYLDGDYEDHRDDFKPVIGVTVSDIGKSTDDKSVLGKKWQGFYGFKNASTGVANDYSTVKTNGYILDASDLMAGQRVAVTVEVGGMDALFVAQLKGTFDKTKLEPGYYPKSPQRGDNWTVQNKANTEQDVAINATYTNADALYPATAIKTGTTILNPDATPGQFAATWQSPSSQGGGNLSSYVGRNASERPFQGKYGIVVATYFFKVLEDHTNLTEAFTFVDNANAGTFVTTFNPDTTEGRVYVTPGDSDFSFANFAITWTDTTMSSTGGEEHEHAWTDVEGTAVPSTCSTYGKEADQVCACGETRTGAALTALDSTNHENVVADDAVAATCCSDGLTAGSHCEACNTVIVAQQAVTERPDHHYVVTEEELPTYTSAGHRVWTCDTCTVTPAATYTEDLAQLTCDHVGTTKTTVGYVAPTCTSVGYSGDSVCDRCGNVAEYGNELGMVAHDYSVEIAPAVVATCTTPSKTAEFKCANCTATTGGVVGEVDPDNHTAVVTDEAQEATCTKTGLTEGSHCDACNKVIVAQQTVGMKDHDYSVEIAPAVVATCSTPAKTAEFKCANCTATTGGVVGDLDPDNHEDVVTDPAKAPTCTETGLTEGSHCNACSKVIVAQDTVGMVDHNYVEVDGSAVEPTKKDAGKAADKKCSECQEVVPGAPIDALGYTVTVAATDLGTVTVDGVDATNGAAVNKAYESKVTLVATPASADVEFVGWVANGATTVSTDATHTAKVLADITYEPVFAQKADNEFSVVFVDSFGNVISAQKVTSGADVTIPEQPALVGYTAEGWSMTAEEIAALTEAATITAQYAPEEAAGYTVTATGCTITVAGADPVADVATGIAYDTQVTVTADGATSWKIGDATVAYGPSYTFYVGSDVEVVPQFDETVTATPTVSNVSVSAFGSVGAVQAAFLATRSMTDDCTFINAGFIYGKNLVEANVTLDDVNGTAVKVAYTTTTSEQFQLNYGLRAQTGSITARAFLAYTDKGGNTVVIYAAPQTFTY